MAELDLERITDAVIGRLAECKDPRFKEVMTSLITHLHAFAREVDLKPDEWFKGLEFMTAVGQATNPQRGEIILLSDTLGLSMLVVMLDQKRIAAGQKGKLRATEATVQGPFYMEGSPDIPQGGDLHDGHNGEPSYYSGKVTDTDGKPLSGALLDIWSGDGEGTYDMQKPGELRKELRGKVRTDAQGNYSFWSIRPFYYPVPVDGPVGRMLDKMGRHPNRPGHIHMMVSAPGHAPVTTHLFVANSPYLESDAVFGVRDSLIVDFSSHQPGVAPDGRKMETPYHTAKYDFRLTPLKAA